MVQEWFMLLLSQGIWKSTFQLQPSIEINQDQAEIWNAKGVVLYEIQTNDLFGILNDLEEAIACYDTTIQLNPMYVRVWCNKATTLHDVSRFREAVECYDRALEIDPECTAAIRGKASSLERIVDSRTEWYYSEQTGLFGECGTSEFRVLEYSLKKTVSLKYKQLRIKLFN